MEKYKATIHGATVEWESDAPTELADRGEIRVEMTLISARNDLPRSDGKKMAEALARIAARGGVKSIPDPVAWQREIRKDRPLPGRD
ncbi:MAG: hypothetical protein KBD94_09535 [Pyrinomonadaceae bacterium]|nr:hypothetical protein [Pyrinomonadaceae bacterium]